MTDRVIIFPGSNELTPEQESEIERSCELFHAKAVAFSWRSGFFIMLVIWRWPWLCGLAEIAHYWIGRYPVECAAIGSLLMLLAFSLQAVRRNKRKAASA